jgi:hypothetical protein
MYYSGALFCVALLGIELGDHDVVLPCRCDVVELGRFAYGVFSSSASTGPRVMSTLRKRSTLWSSVRVDQ